MCLCAVRNGYLYIIQAVSRWPLREKAGFDIRSVHVGFVNEWHFDKFPLSPSIPAVSIGQPILHNHLALHDCLTEGLENFKGSRALSDIGEHLTEHDFHTVSSLVLTAEETAVWGRTTDSPPHARKQFILNLQVTTVCISVISHPAPSSHIGFYIRDKPPCIFGSHQFVYP